MLTIQPPFIGKYFSNNSKITSKNVFFKSFYLSWEDALWHVLKVYNFKKGSVVMVPQFYCGNVVEHMVEHGLKVVTYPVDKYLVTKNKIFRQILLKTKPSIVIVFHPVGIQNMLIKNHKQWASALPAKTVLIEDCVHQIIDPKSIRFINKRHLFIDSLRKVVPVQGSFVYSRQKLPDISGWQNFITLPYRVGVFVLWIIMQINLIQAHFSKSKNLEKLFNKLAEISMLTGYKLIGSNRLASPGIFFMKKISEKINITLIKKSKILQAKIYKTKIKHLLKTGKFWLPKISKSDYSNLRGFPLIIDISMAYKFLNYMRASGVFLRFELNDSAWSAGQKIVYLPMGLHVSSADVSLIIKLINGFKS